MEIYCITKNGNPFYVGFSKDAERRIKEHWYKYVDLFDFDAFVLDIVSDYEATAWEGFYIELLIGWGFTLENRYTNSGCSFIKKSKKVRKRKPDKVYGVYNEDLKSLGAAYLRKIKNEG